MRPPKYMVRPQGYQYSMELIGNDGDYVYTLTDAIEAAESLYGPTGWEVYNGRHGESRLDSERGDL